MIREFVARGTGASLCIDSTDLILGALMIALPAASATAQQGGIELLVGETLFVGGTRLSSTWIHQQGDGLRNATSSIANPDGNQLDRDTLVLGGMHGLRRGTDITLLIPVLSTDAVFGSGPNTVDSDHTALGDVSLTVRQRLHHHLWQRGAWNTSLLGGVQMPTGDDDEIVDGTLLPAPLQAGSGSWDPFASLATTIELDRLRIDANAFYLLPTEGSQGFEAGDVFSSTVTIGYRALMTRYPGPTVSVKAGLRYRHEGRAHQDSTALSGFGREEVSLRFGTTWHPIPNLDLVTTLEVPVYQDVNETQPDIAYRLIAGIGWRF
jgi:hypothetical protein